MREISTTRQRSKTVREFRVVVQLGKLARPVLRSERGQVIRGRRRHGRRVKSVRGGRELTLSTQSDMVVVFRSVRCRGSWVG